MSTTNIHECYGCRFYLPKEMVCTFRKLSVFDVVYCKFWEDEHREERHYQGVKYDKVSDSSKRRD